MRNHNKLSGKGFALGALVGGLFGGMTALMFTPKSGKKMRKDMAKSYNRISDEAHDLMESFCDTSIDLAEKAKEIAEDAETAARKCKKRLH